MSFGLGVLAVDGWTDVGEVEAMVERCRGLVHVDGELDPRIAGFYERLRARFPDYPPYLEADLNPWMDTPLDVGIDHVFMLLSYGERSTPALAMVEELAIEFGLTIWDPQDRSASRPVPAPTRADVEAWWRDLRAGANAKEIFDRVRPWVEGDFQQDLDPITELGLQYVHGFARGVNDGTYLERWLADGERFDADPYDWRRQRAERSIAWILRNEGPDRARQAAGKMVARGWMSTEDADRILGG